MYTHGLKSLDMECFCEKAPHDTLGTTAGPSIGFACTSGNALHMDYFIHKGSQTGKLPGEGSRSLNFLFLTFLLAFFPNSYIV